MPTYEYLCKSCGERLEVQQAFTDEALTECPRCAGPLRKVFGSVGITFKGSGFYKTDSRSGSSASSSSASSTSASESSSSSSERTGSSDSASATSSGDKASTSTPSS